MSLRDYSEKELRAELESRKRRKNLLTHRPIQIPVPIRDWGEIQEKCEAYIDAIAKGKEDLDYLVAIFEATIDAVYGECAWLWINEVGEM